MNYAGLIPSDLAPPSLLQSAHSEWQRGKITENQYHVINAKWVSENLNQYKPLYYSNLPGPLREYCERRITGRSEYERSTAVMLGEWFYSEVQKFQENTKNFELLVWSCERLLESKLLTGCDRIQNALIQFQRLRHPAHEWKLVLDTKSRDSIARHRGGAA